VSIFYIHRNCLANVIKIPMPSHSSHTAARAAVQGKKPNQKIFLIGGARLAALIFEHNPAISIAQTFALKRLAADFLKKTDSK